MAYVALYRAYRPQKFSEVVGQQHIIKTLQNAIKMNKVAHAYLFCGPRGTGKTTLAKIMAKAMNCKDGPIIEPCCQCENCQAIARGMLSDVIEIDAASNNGADDIRELRDTVKFLPAQGKYKVYIIDEVHMLSTAAFNALLKTLEEPPKHVIFILATTEPYKLPNTILSRCQRFDFQSISIEDILKRLRIVAQDENIKITEEALHQIATSAEGGMRDALSLFDQCISFSQNPEITLDDVLAVSGNISYLKMIELLDKCISKSETDAVVLLDKIIREGKEVPRIINDLILFLRDVLLYKNNAVLEQKLMYENEEFQKLSKKLSKPVIYQWLDILNDALGQMRFSVQKRAFLELAVLKMNDVKLNDDANLYDRIESLEKTVEFLQSRGFTAPAAPAVKPEPAAPQVFEMPKTEEVVPVEKNPSDEISTEDISEILNNGNKEMKQKVKDCMTKIGEKYSNVFVIGKLTEGAVMACTSEKALFVVRNKPDASRIMLYESFVKIIEAFQNENVNLKDYICITEDIWNQVFADYRSKYKTNPKPVLNSIPTGIKKRKQPDTNEKKEPENKITELFGENELKITEE